MSPRLDRRTFLRLSTFTAVAVALPGCGKTDKQPSQPEDVDQVFPQGLASGDPGPDSIVLWTRVEPAGSAPETVVLEMANDEAFTDLLQLTGADNAVASSDSDYTLRVRISGLLPHTVYYYRFTARGVTTAAARTVTAPKPEDDVEVKFAFSCCQDYVDRYYHAWDAIAAEDIDFVVHLGDYIYELPGASQGGRGIHLPDGMQVNADRAALTLADYRTLYKTYRSDPALKRMHARAPFIVMWDDHEFSDDCWGDHGTYFDEAPATGNEEDPVRRHAASQAFWEYQPLGTAATWDPTRNFPDDIKIYRSFQFGQHVELFLTDERYYRDDQPIPEGPPGSDLDPKLIYKTANSTLGSRQFVIKSALDRIEGEKKPTMLGAAQKQWLMNGVKTSVATWKVWGSEVQLAQMVVDLTDYIPLPDYKAPFYIEVDQWDGYRTERAEILAAFQAVPNVVSIAGDIHAFYAAELQVDFDNPGDPAAVEFTGAGITSQSLRDEIYGVVNDSPLFKQLGLLPLVDQLDAVLMKSSPHYRFSRSKANGVSLVKASATEFRVTYVILPTEAVLQPTFDGSPERVDFRVAAGVKAIQKL